jgi:AcrR family transcriptional regulator
MAIRIDTDHILASALRAIGRVGLQKLAMVDVAEEAGISRHTLFRRFRTQDEMLEALGDYVVRRFDQWLRAAIEAKPDPALRVRLIVGCSFDLVREDSLGRLLELEPRFFRRFLKHHIAECLKLPAVWFFWPQPLPGGPRGRAVAEAAELILRYGVSLVVAEPESWARETSMMTRIVETLLEESVEQRLPRAGRLRHGAEALL